MSSWCSSPAYMGEKRSSSMRKLFFTDILTSRRPNFHLDYVLSLVVRLDTHRYMASIFPFLLTKAGWAPSAMVRGGDRTRRRESEVLWPAGSVFQLWFIRTTNTSAVCRPASATSREPTACGRKPRTSGVHAEQGEGDLRGALHLCPGFSPLP